MKDDVKVKWSERICYGSGMGGSVILSQLLATFFLSYYTDTMLVNALAISTMFLVCRFFDGITDVIVGALIDKTKTRFGKARPWILVDSFLIAISIAALFAGNASWSNGGKLFYAYATYMFANCVAYTIFGIGNNVLLANMTMNIQERTTLSTISMFINNVVVMLVGSVVTPMVSAMGWRNVSIVMGLVAGILIFLQFIGTQERVGLDIEALPVKKEESLSEKEQLKFVLKNKYFWLIMLFNVLLLMMNANSLQSVVYYCNWVLEKPEFITLMMSIGNIPSLVAMIFVPELAKRFSKQGVLIGCSVLMALSFILMGLAGNNAMVALIAFAFKTLAVSPMFSLPFALVADIVDYNEYNCGVRCEGMVSISSSIGVKVGIGFGAALTGWILGFSGYDGAAAVQSASALAGIKFSFCWSGLIFSVLIFAVTLLLDIEKKSTEIHEGLMKRRGEL